MAGSVASGLRVFRTVGKFRQSSDQGGRGMQELTADLLAKLDEDLRKVCSSKMFAEQALLPVTLRCSVEYVGDVAEEIVRHGGRVRHQFTLLGAVSGWVPYGAIPDLAAREYVTGLEMDHQFTLA